MKPCLPANTDDPLRKDWTWRTHFTNVVRITLDKWVIHRVDRQFYSNTQECSYLKVLHNLDQLGAVGWRQAAPLVEDGLQLSSRQLIKVKLHKAVPESPGEHLETS